MIGPTENIEAGKVVDPDLEYLVESLLWFSKEQYNPGSQEFYYQIARSIEAQVKYSIDQPAPAFAQLAHEIGLHAIRSIEKQTGLGTKLPVEIDHSDKRLGLLGIICVHTSSAACASADFIEFEALSPQNTPKSLEYLNRLQFRYRSSSVVLSTFGMELLGGSQAHRAWGEYKAARAMLDAADYNSDDKLIDIAGGLLHHAHRHWVVGFLDEVDANLGVEIATHKLLTWAAGMLKTDIKFAKKLPKSVYNRLIRFIRKQKRKDLLFSPED